MDFAQYFPRSESQIARAKRSAVGGKRKRCTKGKNCSAACIAAHMVCLVDLPWVGPDLTKVKTAILKKSASAQKPLAQWAGGGAPAAAAPKKQTWKPNLPEPKAPAAAAAPAKAPSVAPSAPQPKTFQPSQAPLPNAGLAQQKAYGFDKNFPKPLRVEGDANFNGWGDSYKPGSKKLGQGAFGTVVESKDGTVIKRGIISDSEAKAIEVAGKAGIGPRLIAAHIGKNNDVQSGSPVQLKDGRIAMTKIEGKEAEELNGKTINGVTATDAFWRARAGLHKAGIAHNDMHTENVLIDDKGVGRIVDLGMAQISPKAALSEGLGAFTAPGVGKAIPGVGKGKGDWQVKQWETSTAGGLLKNSNGPNASPKALAEIRQKHPGLAQILDNRDRVISRMKALGYDNDEIETLFVTGIRNKEGAYTKGPWAKMDDAQAKELINLLYDGV
jgi:hypothetical protein